MAFGGRGRALPLRLGHPTRVRPRRATSTRPCATTLVELFPALAGAAITHRWGGPLGIARDWFTSVGLDRATGLAWAGGYVGDGVSTTNLAGGPCATSSSAATTELTALAWVGHRSRRWEPEPLRYARHQRRTATGRQRRPGRGADRPGPPGRPGPSNGWWAAEPGGTDPDPGAAGSVLVGPEDVGEERALGGQRRGAPPPGPRRMKATPTASTVPISGPTT